MFWTVRRSLASWTTRRMRWSGRAPARPRSINTAENSDITRSPPTDRNRIAATSAALPQRSPSGTARSASASAVSPSMARVDPGLSRTPMDTAGPASSVASDRLRGPYTMSPEPSHRMSIAPSGWTPSACDPTVTVSCQVAATQVASSRGSAVASYIARLYGRARPIRTSRPVTRAARLERSDRPFAAPPVTLVPAAVGWPARIAHRNTASTRGHPLPDLPDHRVVPRCWTHRSLPGDTADLPRALRRRDRRSRRPAAPAHPHSDRPRGMLGRARDRDAAWFRARALPLRVHGHRCGLLGPRRSRPRRADAKPRAAGPAPRSDGAEPGPLPDRVDRGAGHGRHRHPHVRRRRRVLDRRRLVPRRHRGRDLARRAAPRSADPSARRSRPRRGPGALPGEPHPLRNDAARLPRDVLRFASRALPVLRGPGVRGRTPGARPSFRGARNRVAHRRAHIRMDEARAAPGRCRAARGRRLGPRDRRLRP